MASFSVIKGPVGSNEKELVDAQLVDSQTIQQTMEILPKGTRRLAAQLRTSIAFESLWKVLTAYEKLSDFIPNLSSSEILSRDLNKVQLRQVGTQDFFGFKFSAEVFLELEELKAEGVLKFHLLKGDFQRFDGAWILRECPKGDGIFLLYELTVQGCVGMPVALIEQRLTKDLSENLLAVEKTALKTSLL